MIGSFRSPRPARTLAATLAAAVAVLAGCVSEADAPGASSQDAVTGSPHTNTPDDTGAEDTDRHFFHHEGEVEWQVRQLEDEADEPDNSRTPPGTEVRSNEPLIAVGLLHASRLQAFRLDDLISAATSDTELAITGQSPTVGAATALLALEDGRIAVASTDHREIVVLDDDWTEHRTYSFETQLQPQSLVSYGSLVHFDNRLVVSHGTDGYVGVSAVDLDSGEKSSSIWRDVNGSFPAMCHLPGTGLAIVGSQHVVLADPRTLERHGGFDLHGYGFGAACVDQTVWVASAERPALLGFDPTGRKVQELAWDGEVGSPWLIADAHGELWVSDPAARVVARCRPHAGCTNSPQLASAPGTLLPLGDHVVATNEQPGQVHVLDRSTLAALGSIDFPEGTRSLTLLR